MSTRFFLCGAKTARLVVLLPLFFLFSKNAAAECEKFASVSSSYNAKKGIERGQTSLAVEYGVESERYEALFGFQSNDLIYDVCAEGTFWIFLQRLDRLSLKYGADAIYHFQNFDYKGVNISSENDFFSDFCFSIEGNKGASFTARTGGGAKLTHLCVLGERIWDTSFSFRLEAKKRFDFGLTLGAFVGTHTFYRYPLFCSPEYSLLASYDFDSGVRVSMSGGIRISDQFTTAPYISRETLKASVLVFLR